MTLIFFAGLIVLVLDFRVDFFGDFFRFSLWG